jgi:hypothetical protein
VLTKADGKDIIKKSSVRKGRYDFYKAAYEICLCCTIAGSHKIYFHAA